jgi:hypothetical protein
MAGKKSLSAPMADRKKSPSTKVSSILAKRVKLTFGKRAQLGKMGLERVRGQPVNSPSVICRAEAADAENRNSRYGGSVKRL